LTIVFGLVLGIMNTYGTAIGIICNQLNYSEDNASLFGAVFIVGGIVGSGVFGGIVEVYKNYRVATIVICSATALTPIALLFSLQSHSVALVTTSCFVVGFASVSILPVGIDFGVELTHPIPESISSGLLMSMGQFFGIIFTIVVSIIITRKGDAGVILGQSIMIVMAGIAAVLSFFVKEDLKRLKEQKSTIFKGEVKTIEDEITESGLII